MMLRIMKLDAADDCMRYIKLWPHICQNWEREIVRITNARKAINSVSLAATRCCMSRNRLSRGRFRAFVAQALICENESAHNKDYIKYNRNHLATKKRCAMDEDHSIS